MDKITEAIAHFIGLFEVSLEEARLRDQYDEFRALKARQPDEGDLWASQETVKAPYSFEGFAPELKYVSPGPELTPLDVLPYFRYTPQHIPIAPAQEITISGSLKAHLQGAWPGTAIDLPDLQPPGSVATVIAQYIRLHDDDYFSVGEHGLVFSPAISDGSELIALMSEAKNLSPLRDLQISDLSEGARDFSTTVTELIAAPYEPGDEAEVFTVHSATIEGTYVNGQLVDEAPELEDYLDLKKDEEDEEEREEEGEENDGIVHGSDRKGETAEAGSSISHSGNEAFKASVELQAGGNLLVNSVSLENNWLAGSVCAVVGDHIEINAVIQINAWCDTDWLTTAFGSLADGPPTQAFNIATFERLDPSKEATGAGDALESDFPKHWVVQEIDGDLMIMNWLEQYTFMMDNDIGVLSSSGVTTRIIGGGNTATNDISLTELGKNYDLIIIGGSVFDLNIIQQLNILFENDLIGATPGFQTSGTASVSMSDNLLWNQAHIYTIGRADRFEALSEAYGQAAASFANGNGSLSDGVLNDSAFAGLETLRVLYIKGDLIDVQFVKQTNILGDSDQVALAMDAVRPHPESDWTLSTGANSLVNMAGILDVDAAGKTYVGGSQYSDELLIQAELISSDPDLGAQDPDKLATEAVAFLGDDTTDANQNSPEGAGYTPTDAGQSDGLQSMLA
ncbi:type I secretion protein [Nitratireductor thuwali]